MANCIIKKSSPTIETIGYIGQRYVDVNTGDVYECVDINTVESIDDGPVHPHNFVDVTRSGKLNNEYVWEKIVSGSGAGGSDIVFNVFYESDGRVITCNKSYSEVRASMLAGDTAKLILFENSDIREHYQLDHFGLEDDGMGFIFVRYAADIGNHLVIRFAYNPDGSILEPQDGPS